MQSELTGSITVANHTMKAAYDQAHREVSLLLDGSKTFVLVQTDAEPYLFTNGGSVAVWHVSFTWVQPLEVPF